jgi:hypothetical protein
MCYDLSNNLEPRYTHHLPASHFSSRPAPQPSARDPWGAGWLFPPSSSPSQVALAYPSANGTVQLASQANTKAAQATIEVPLPDCPTGFTAAERFDLTVPTERSQVGLWA